MSTSYSVKEKAISRHSKSSVGDDHHHVRHASGVKDLYGNATLNMCGSRVESGNNGLVDGVAVQSSHLRISKMFLLALTYYCYTTLIILGSVSVDARSILVKGAALGTTHTCVVLETKQVKCFGHSTKGALGYGSTEDKINTGDFLPYLDLNLSSVESLCAGEQHVCALSSQGRIKCWGKGIAGQLGNDDDIDVGDEPGEMGANLKFVNLGIKHSTYVRAIQIACGFSHTCALTDDYQVKCWGLNNFGQLGQGNTNSIGNSPNDMQNLMPIDLGTNRTAKKIAAGGQRTCAILDDDSLKCWGSGSSGGLGNGRTDIHLGDESDETGDNLPTVDLGLNRTAKDISCSYYHTCVLRNDSSVVCFGSNAVGELGIETTSTSSSADVHSVNLGDERTVVSIHAGFQVSCAIFDDHSAKCWGQNSNGWLLTGDTTDRGGNPGDMQDLDILRLGSRTFDVIDIFPVTVFVGQHICALTSPTTLQTQGNLVCWGGDLGHQLGQPSTFVFTYSGSDTDLPNLYFGEIDETLAPTKSPVTTTCMDLCQLECDVNDPTRSPTSSDASPTMKVAWSFVFVAQCFLLISA